MKGINVQETMKALTQQDNDAEQDGNDGSGAQPCTHNPVHIRAVPVGVTLAHLHTQNGSVGFGRITRICDHDGNLIDTSLKKFYLQIQLSKITYVKKENQTLTM